MFVLMAVTAICQMGFSQQQSTNDNKQQQGTARMRHHKGEHRHQKMMNALNLSEEQKSKMKEMRMANKEKKDAIINNSSLSESQKKEQLKTLRKENAGKFESVLTDEQKTKIKTMRAQRKNERKWNDGKLKRPEQAEKVIDNTNQ